MKFLGQQVTPKDLEFNPGRSNGLRWFKPGGVVKHSVRTFGLETSAWIAQGQGMRGVSRETGIERIASLAR